jgi:MFS family permease
MLSARIAKLCAGRVHYAWVALWVVFAMTLAVVGVRAAPGVLIVPLERAFGWSAGTISGAVSLNILLMGLTGPFLTGLMETIGIKRTILLAMLVLIAGTALSALMHTPWQLYLTWGLMIGVGAGAGAIGVAAAVANRWFMTRRGLVMGLLTAANAAGQLIFLPLLAALADRYGWRSVSITVTLAVAAMLPWWPCCCRSGHRPSAWHPTARPRNRSRRRAKAIRSPWRCAAWAAASARSISG